MSDWDLVLRGGRVIDPESGLDAVRDVAIAQGRIVAVRTGLPAAAVDVDVAGQVVTAGFIDLHSHVSDLGGLRLQASDGVTTALELEAGLPRHAGAEVVRRPGQRDLRGARRRDCGRRPAGAPGPRGAALRRAEPR